MNWTQIENAWNDYKGDFQRHWNRVPRLQLANTRGRREELAAHVQRVYGISREETEAQISDWQSRQLERLPLPVMK
jgi:uncharacterized protein YjbJ (UPF0337 family)